MPENKASPCFTQSGFRQDFNKLSQKIMKAQYYTQLGQAALTFKN